MNHFLPYSNNLQYRFACCALLLALLSSPAFASDENAPAFKNLRYEENWSQWHWQDPDGFQFPSSLKHLESPGHPDVWLSVGGQLRLRAEHSSNFAFSDRNDDGFGLSRLRLHADLHLGDYFRVFLEGKSALATDRDLPGGRRTADVDELDLQNGFVEVSIPLQANELRVSVGRREMLFGKQRLISPADWANSRQSFDGAHVIFETGHWKVDGFWTRPVVVDKFSFNRAR